MDDKQPTETTKENGPRVLSPRGGGLIEFMAINVEFLIKTLVAYLAENGLFIGAATGTTFALSQILANKLATYLRNASPSTFTQLEKKKSILVTGKKIYFNQWDQNLKYLFQILEDEHISFEEKEKVARSILTKYLNLKTINRHLTFVMCIVFVIFVLSDTNPSGLYILFKNLIQAIKEVRISKLVDPFII